MREEESKVAHKGKGEEEEEDGQRLVGGKERNKICLCSKISYRYAIENTTKNYELGNI